MHAIKWVNIFSPFCFAIEEINLTLASLFIYGFDHKIVFYRFCIPYFGIKEDKLVFNIDNIYTYLFRIKFYSRF